MYEYRAQLDRSSYSGGVIDGDTLVLDIDLGWDVWLRGQHCRLLGIDAPERHTDAGKRAKQYLESVLGDHLVVKTTKDKTGSFGRMLVTVFRDGRDLNELMVKSGHAKVRMK
jgi:endonuclease YncB( thermonuclease family)